MENARVTEDVRLAEVDRPEVKLPAEEVGASWVVPESLKIGDAGDMRLSPNDMRELKAATGRKLTELTGEQADEADAMQTMAWLHLRRSGNPVPWELLGDVAIEFEVDVEPDPTSVAPSPTSPNSAAIGGTPPERSTP